MKDITDIYKTVRWQKLRFQQLQADNFECQRCKHRGKYKGLQGLVKYTKAQLVHHEFRVRQYPQYAFSRFVNGKRNLYSLCESCHEIEHKEERNNLKKIEELNDERW